ncbi:hypothetical protein MWU60_16390 [Yoonia sp. F2084L]|uniref:M16 family metallopeptidase n=1 Tax=Yoonia sp. F2084L TaxID=2926419 RepID=UPI001FF6E012|nr:hypothetical protein [Yoonia sp. F2084L]MCK0097157.1 hypothetical protein [Yoonia sp. F2084L]
MSSTFKAAVFVAAFAAVAVTYSTWQEQAKASSGVIVAETQASDVTAYLVWPNPPAAPGLAHYVEHLAWANAMGGQERRLDNHSNAWTSGYAIGYWLSGRPDDLPDVLQQLLNTAQPLTVDPIFAGGERDVLMREYDFRLGNNIDMQAAERMDAFLYEGNQIATSVIGSRDDITALTYDDARAFHAKTHTLDAATLVVVGDVSRRQVSRALRNIGHPEDDFGTAGVTPVPFSLAVPETAYFRFPKENAAPRVQFRRVVPLDAPMDFDLLEVHAILLRNILDANVPGGLAGPLRFDAAFARSFQVSIWPLDEQHVELFVTAEPDRGVTLKALSDEIENVLQTIAADGIPIGSYRRLKDRFEGFWPNWTDEGDTQSWMADYTLERVSSLRRPLPPTSVRGMQGQISAEVVNMLMDALGAQGRTAITFIGPERTFE